jgi:hypothetical protein
VRGAKRGDRGFANAALAGGHGDDLPDAGEALLLRQTIAHRHSGVHFHANLTNPGQRGDGLTGHVFQLIADRAGRRGQAKGELRDTIFDLHVLDHAERDEVAAEFGVHDIAESAQDVLGGE